MLRHLLGIVKVADHQVFADSNGETTEEEGTEEDAKRFIQRQEGQHPDHELRGAAIAEGRQVDEAVDQDPLGRSIAGDKSTLETLIGIRGGGGDFNENEAADGGHNVLRQEGEDMVVLGSRRGDTGLAKGGLGHLEPEFGLLHPKLWQLEGGGVGEGGRGVRRLLVSRLGRVREVARHC